MRLKESLFWILIIGLLFGGGYLHGSLPFSQLKSFFKPDKHLRLLVHSPHFLPEDLLKKIEKKSYTIRLDPVEQFEDLKIELLKSPTPDLVLIPYQWHLRLRKENLLHRINSNFQNEFAVDFSRDTQWFYPWFWFATKAFQKSSTSPKDQKIEVLIAGEQPNQLWIESLLNDYPAQFSQDKNIKAFLPHTLKISDTTSSFEKPSSELWIFGWSIPKSSESAEDSLNLLLDLYEYPVYESALLAVPGASTLERTNQEPWDHWKKPKSLRDLPLDSIIRH